jgi:membrane protein implicated in regulation of membrane protease activity
MHSDNVELFIPIVLFISIAAVLVFASWFRHRSQAGLQQTIRNAMDKGVQLTPEIIESLGQPKAPPHSDLRRALVSLGIGVAFVAFGFILNEEDAVRPLAAIGMFPIAVGIAYLLMWRFTEGRK